MGRPKISPSCLIDTIEVYTYICKYIYIYIHVCIRIGNRAAGLPHFAHALMSSSKSCSPSRKQKLDLKNTIYVLSTIQGPRVCIYLQRAVVEKTRNREVTLRSNQNLRRKRITRSQWHPLGAKKNKIAS